MVGTALRAFAPLRSRIPRMPCPRRRASNTPRPIEMITTVPMYWIARSSRAMTARRVAPTLIAGSVGSRRFADRVVDQGLAERPDRAGDLVALGDHVVEGPFDPAAVLFGDRQRRQQLD